MLCQACDDSATTHPSGPFNLKSIRSPMGPLSSSPTRFDTGRICLQRGACRPPFVDTLLTIICASPPILNVSRSQTTAFHRAGTEGVRPHEICTTLTLCDASRPFIASDWSCASPFSLGVIWPPVFAYEETELENGLGAGVCSWGRDTTVQTAHGGGRCAWPGTRFQQSMRSGCSFSQIMMSYKMATGAAEDAFDETSILALDQSVHRPGSRSGFVFPIISSLLLDFAEMSEASTPSGKGSGRRGRKPPAKVPCDDCIARASEKTGPSATLELCENCTATLHRPRGRKQQEQANKANTRKARRQSYAVLDTALGIHAEPVAMPCESIIYTPIVA